MYAAQHYRDLPCNDNDDDDPFETICHHRNDHPERFCHDPECFQQEEVIDYSPEDIPILGAPSPHSQGHPLPPHVPIHVDHDPKESETPMYRRSLSYTPSDCRRGRSPRRYEKKWNKQFVWPRDVKYDDGRWGPLDRCKDLMTGKGPDIHIADLHSRQPFHPVYSNWKTPGYHDPNDGRLQWTNRGYYFRTDDENLSPFKAARREDGKKYDHRSRRYRTPGPGVWSDVVRGKHRGDGPRYYRDHLGIERVDPIEDGGLFNYGVGLNPFAPSP